MVGATPSKRIVRTCFWLEGRETSWFTKKKKKCQTYAMIKTYRFYSLLCWSPNGYSYQRKLLLRDNSGIQPPSIFWLHQRVVLIVAQGGSVWLKDERRKCTKGLPIFQPPQEKGGEQHFCSHTVCENSMGSLKNNWDWVI